MLLIGMTDDEGFCLSFSLSVEGWDTVTKQADLQSTRAIMA